MPPVTKWTFVCQRKIQPTVWKTWNHPEILHASRVQTGRRFRANFPEFSALHDRIHPSTEHDLEESPAVLEPVIWFWVQVCFSFELLSRSLTRPQTCCIAKGDFELLMFLPPYPRHWDYKYVSLHLALSYIYFCWYRFTFPDWLGTHGNPPASNLWVLGL